MRTLTAVKIAYVTLPNTVKLLPFSNCDELCEHCEPFFFFLSLFHRAFRFTKFYLYQRMHLFLSYTKIT